VPSSEAVAGCRDSPFLWLSSTRPDRRPHLVAVWFLWDGDALLTFSKPGAQKVRNVRSDPRVMVGVGEPGDDVQLVEGVAELAAESTRDVLTQAFEQKYGAAMAATGGSSQRFAEIYSQPIRIRPTRWLDWGMARV
jgi:PPOX class probable F420-dependent enzyme